jgi:large subunit ribosomal protein L9
MKVILKHDVDNVGKRGDIVNVAPGFGRNYLIPKKLAMAVTSSNLKMVEIERQALKKRLEKERLSYQDQIAKLNAVTLRFTRKAGEKDMIFGSVSLADIKGALDELGFEVDKKKIVFDEPIKRLGHYTVPIKVFHEDKAEIGVEVVKEETGGPEDKPQPLATEETSEE